MSGLTIKRGKVSQYGGGILCSVSSPLIKNCRILNNEAYRIGDYKFYGGGIACINDSRPKIIGCIIKSNTAGDNSFHGEDEWKDAYGGGVYCDSQSSVDIYDSEIIYNRCEAGAFELWPLYCEPDSVFGGGLYLAGENTSNIVNCIIAYNSAIPGCCFNYDDDIYVYGLSEGGGIYCGSNVIISNCTIYHNDTGGDWEYGSGIYGSPMVTDSIIWNNISAQQIYGSATVTYSDIQGGFTGTGNISLNPEFVSGPDGNYYLSQIAAGQASNSPCVDAGSDTAAGLGMNIYTTATNQILDTDIVDMGYHYPLPLLSADINGDYYVDFLDYALWADNLTRNSKTIPKGNVNVDGQLDDWQGDIEWMPLDKVYFGSPNDVNEAKFALQWDPNTDKIYAAVIVTDTNHVFLDEYNEWDASDRIEIYSQGDAAGGSGWYGIYDAAQHYMVGPNTSAGSWGTWALGQTPLGDEGLEYAVVVNGDEVVYEIGVQQFDNYGGFSGGDTVVSDLDVGHIVRFDIVADTRWDEEGFGMLSENLMTGKFDNADKFARYMLVEQLGGPPCFERDSDLFADCFLDFKDLAIFAAYWLNCFVQPADYITPADNSIGPIAVVLSWSSGKGAISHDVYLGTNESDVIGGTEDAYQGNVVVNTWDPCGLEPDTTYFWRIDEVGPRCIAEGDVLSFTTAPPTAIVSWWKFDEGEGFTAYDSVSTNHGSITGASWTTGQVNGALSFDGDGDYVNVGDKASLELQCFTLNFWAQHNNPSGSFQGGIAEGKIFGNPGEFAYKLDFSNSKARASISNTYFTAFTVTASLTDTDWHMWTMTVGYNVLSIYKDGQLQDFTSYNGTIYYSKMFALFTIGAYTNGFYSFDGVIDDIRFYNGTLTDEDIWQLYEEGLSNKASFPYPENNAVFIDPNVVLSWIPGKDAVWHDVYFGTDFNDVNNAVPDSNEYQGQFDINSWDPCGLEMETTYFWRIDEINDPNVYKGDTWNFTTFGPLTEHLVSWWKFDEGQGNIAYDSAGDNYGVINGATWTIGQINGALSFDGNNDYVGVGDKANLELQSFTLSFWAKHNNPSGSLQGGIAKGKIFGAPYEFSYKLDFSNSQARASVTNTSDTAFTVTAPLADTYWHFWSMTVGDGTLSLYKDGVIQDSTPYTGSIDYTKSVNNFAIGAYTDGQYAFDGIIDDVRIYERALSDEKIWQLYQEGLGN